jgi:hypothetical protein
MSSSTIAFHTPTIDERGTCIAIFDYAHYNEILLKNTSIIITSYTAFHNAASQNSQVLLKFTSRFPLFLYHRSIKELDDDVLKFCRLLYTIKYGSLDYNLSQKTKNAIHCVFDMSQPHGDIYAGVSQQLAAKFNSTLFVPHMVNFAPDPLISPLTFRRSLNIPDDATVFGRHGGFDTFDIPFVKETIHKIVRIKPDTFFIFINTPAFTQHPNIFFLHKIIDIQTKKQFISSCDAMIHAQSLGESFGLSIAEFSSHQKPIICYGNWVLNDNYRHILKDKAIYYHSEAELTDILFHFDKNLYKNRTDLNCYTEYSPENVMACFQKVFLK